MWWYWAVVVSHMPSQLCDGGGKQLINFQLLCFSLSVYYSVNCMRYLTLYDKMGFVIDGFAQLLASEVS